MDRFLSKVEFMFIESTHFLMLSLSSALIRFFSGRGMSACEGSSVSWKSLLSLVDPAHVGVLDGLIEVKVSVEEHEYHVFRLPHGGWPHRHPRKPC